MKDSITIRLQDEIDHLNAGRYEMINLQKDVQVHLTRLLVDAHREIQRLGLELEAVGERELNPARVQRRGRVR